MAKKRHKQWVAAEDPPSKEVEEALDLVKAIEDTYEDEVSDQAKIKGEDFFDNILDKAKSIGETIERSQRVSEAQKNALESMLGGVRKWVHRDS